MTVSTSTYVPPPPSAAQRTAELLAVHALTDHRTAALDAKAIDLDKRGAWSLWQAEAGAYRQQVGFLRGWAGTLRMDAAIGASVLVAAAAKHKYAMQRPFQMDPSITPLGHIPTDTSYPSGHSSASAAAATVLSSLNPDRSQYYAQLAADVRWARVYSGVHMPSDTLAGAQLGAAIGEHFAR